MPRCGSNSPVYLYCFHGLLQESGSRLYGWNRTRLTYSLYIEGILPGPPLKTEIEQVSSGQSGFSSWLRTNCPLEEVAELRWDDGEELVDNMGEALKCVVQHETVELILSGRNFGGTLPHLDTLRGFELSMPHRTSIPTTIEHIQSFQFSQ
jgi:hypothetical protein